MSHGKFTNGWKDLKVDKCVYWCMFEQLLTVTCVEVKDQITVNTDETESEMSINYGENHYKNGF